jgi:hypothetical protein
VKGEELFDEAEADSQPAGFPPVTILDLLETIENGLVKVGTDS